MRRTCSSPNVVVGIGFSLSPGYQLPIVGGGGEEEGAPRSIGRPFARNPGRDDDSTWAGNSDDEGNDDGNDDGGDDCCSGCGDDVGGSGKIVLPDFFFGFPTIPPPPLPPTCLALPPPARPPSSSPPTDLSATNPNLSLRNASSCRAYSSFFRSSAERF